MSHQLNKVSEVNDVFETLSAMKISQQPDHEGCSFGC